MKAIKFTKMVASGNDFIITELKGRGPALRNLVRHMCDRRYGIGADGLLLLEKSKKADIRMRIFNVDGSEAQMCGNGARCVALRVARHKSPARSKVSIETAAGIIESRVNGDNVKIKLTDPRDIKLDIPVKVNNRKLKVNFTDTGVPHVIIFVQGLDKIDALNLGRIIRYHKKFAPRGTNVNFVEVLNKNAIKIRTYERGVEDETLACGTGAVAASLISNIKYPCLSGRQEISNTVENYKMNVYTKSGEILKVCFTRQGNKFSDVWLEGRVKVVHEGVYYV
jgi:diaminopimelate epimerase